MCNFKDRCWDNASYKIVKFMLFFYACSWWLVGTFILGVGIYAEIERQRYKTLEGVFLAPAIILIVLGLLMFIVSLIGAVATLRDHLPSLKAFMYSLSVCLIIELVCGLVGLTFHEQTTKLMNKNVQKGIINYYDDLDFKNLMDFFQMKLKCCGAKDYKDWELNMYHNCSGVGRLSCGVPYTCCISTTMNEVPNTLCGHNVLHKERLEVQNIIHARGCTDAVKLWVLDNIKIVAALLLAIILPQLFGIVITWRFIMIIEEIKEEEERRRLDPQAGAQRATHRQKGVAACFLCMPLYD